ncbi:MAG: T9SS C-terminal target domain-containing protein, partial [Ignavibacteriae bacterium]
QAVPIVVSSVNSVDEDIHAPALVVSPNPFYGSAPLLISGLPATADRLSIVASNGAMVYDVALDPTASEQPFDLPTLPSGTYAVLVSTRTGVVSAPLVVLK